ncbi:DUF6152 family protein [Adhaeribacter pallidiroseus]|uniref:Uncharacterized protein n=1 Tax=Adhaeribacter pallidiroseus TaxID=2072847 RepID=A0A369QAE2_9BACT|nr:DUF6152 family protein [Adhaeribacter pallidiroseus]RDC61664.1 hypothetical protein AHMF7616_00244 [Adhaeribacter pallidiroseus]
MVLLRNSLAACIFLVLTSFTLFHHGWADYDQTKVLDYTGTIEEFTYENPHALAKVKQDDKVWTVYLAPPSRMESRGVPKAKLAKGNSVRVVGYPHKEVKDEMRAERIFVDGNKFELR